MSELRNNAGTKNPFYGRRHTEETRRKMSEAHKGKCRQHGSAASCYRMLIAAIVKQAVKDGAAWFFETETGKSYCAVAGINPKETIGIAYNALPRR
jgi:hypothetical protein